MYKKNTLKDWAIYSIILCLMLGGVYLYIRQFKEIPVYLIPENYVGDVTIKYNQPGYPPLPKEGRYRIINIPDNGFLNTSTPEPIYETMKFYFVDEKGNRKEFDQEKYLQSGGVGGPKGHTIEHFRIGTKEQINEWLKNKGATPKHVLGGPPHANQAKGIKL